jgi:ATP-binding cassette subfamily F protein 3
MIRLANITIRFGEEYLFRDLTWNIGLGERLALVGPNGAGKSTLFKVAMGFFSPTDGQVVRSRRTRMGYLPQEEVVMAGRSVLDEAMSAFGDRLALKDEADELATVLASMPPDDPEYPAVLERYGQLSNLFEKYDGYQLEAKAKEVLQGLGFAPGDLCERVETFSGGWQMRLALAKLLLEEPSYLLLDEPTNHLDIEAMDFLESFLRGFKGAVAIISHDRYFVDRTVRKVYELELGRFSVYHTNYTGYLKEKEKRRELLIKQREQQTREIEHVREFIARWKGNYIKRAMVTSRERMLERLLAERIEIPSDPRQVKLRLPEPPHCGQRLLELKGVSKSYGEKTVLSGVDLLLLRGRKLALAGVNGAGKTTLMRILAGQDPCFQGERREYPDVTIAYFSQQTAEMLDPGLTVLETIEAAAPELRQEQARTVLGAFLFPGDAVYKKVKVLSGGEKSRLALCKILMTPANLLVMDEPTNHLDLASKIILERALQAYRGSLVLVTHDRYLMDRVADTIVEVAGGGIKLYPGNYTDYIWKKQQTQLTDNSNQITTVKAVSSIKEGWKEAKRRKGEAEAAERRHRRKVEELEERIHRLEQRQKALESDHGGLADPEVYSNGEKMKGLMNEFQANREEMRRLYDRWEKYIGDEVPSLSED